jgi:hypothetical protein
MYTCPVNCSMGAVAVRVTEATLEPATDCGLLYPEPEFCMGISVIVKVGDVVVDPRNVTSGRTRHTNPKWSPSSMSNSVEYIHEGIDAGVPVILLSSPFSWYTMLLLYVAAIG